MDHLFRQRRLSVPKRTSELVALIAVSCTLFLFLHTRDLSTKLQRMERLSNDVTAFNQRTDKLPTAHTYTSAQGSREQMRNSIDTAPSESMVENEVEVEEDIPDVWELNNTARAGVELLLFNRVPKVGSQTFMELMRRLAAKNGFGWYRDGVQRMETIRMLPQDQEHLVKEIMSFPTPGSYGKHVCYTNFTKFGYPNPIYINMVRDPVERVISWYYYVRAPWYFVERKQIFPDLPMPDPNWLKKDFETCVLSGDSECHYGQGETHEGIGDHRRQMLFFCGHDYQCTPFNGFEVMQRAKRVVEEQYAVVGVLEDMNATLLALERYVPRFFQGASSIYHNQSSTFHRINRNIFKPTVSEEVKQIVRQNFTREIEFYEFCKQRLYNQLRALKDPTIVLPTKRSRRRRAFRRI